MSTKNRVLEIIEQRGFKNPTPTDKVLTQLGMTARRFQKVVRNEGVELTITETIGLCKWLAITQEQLVVSDEFNAVEK